MAVRPNIHSLALEGTDLVVRGESDKPLPTVIHVVVVQGTGASAAQAFASGIADRVGSGWRATLKDTELAKGPAEAMGVEVRIRPFEITSWVQSVTIA